MHELNNIQSILNQAILDAHENKFARITSLHIAIGELSELDSTTIQQDWRQLSRGTLAEHAQLHIRLIAAELQCMACFSKYQPVAKKILCPYCGSVGAKILTGEECHLESVEAEHD